MACHSRRECSLTRKRFEIYRRAPPARLDTGTRQLKDSSDTFISAYEWLGGSGSDARANAERRAEDLVRGNRGLLSDMGLDVTVTRRRGNPGLHIKSGTRVGAIPLRSPVSGRVDFGLVVTPRFPWTGVGDLLASTGFRILPQLLPVEELPQSERHIPPWVLATVVLHRLERLIDVTSRRFETVHEDRSAPRGAVAWETYATERFSQAKLLNVPCAFPDLRDDKLLRSAIHWTVRRQRELLLSAPAGGRIVRELVDRCNILIARLTGSPPAPPNLRLRAAWRHRQFSPRVFSEGVAAIDWTVDERGLAGLSDLAGLSWRLDMATFFEAWVETIAAWTAMRVGAKLRCGRLEQTRVTLDWTSRYAGSQGSLLPDIVIERNDVVVILDAKYKQHAEDIRKLGWFGTADAVREQHRADLLQALAYSTLFDAPRIVTLLVYPCGIEKWQALRSTGAVLALARARTAPRNVEIGLLAVPLGGDLGEPGAVLEDVIRRGEGT